MEIHEHSPVWLAERVLPDHVSLQVLDMDGNVLHESAGKWLHPLLEVEQVLSNLSVDPSMLVLHDRIAGRAAASLGVRMGFKTVKLCVMSRLAQQVYERHGITYAAVQVVDRIACRTEELIDDSMNLDAVHELILKRAEAGKLGKSNNPD